MILTTTYNIENYDIIKYYGLVTANEVIGFNIINENIASFTDFFGGKSGRFRNKFNQLYREIESKLASSARERNNNVNAVIGIQIKIDQFTHTGSMLMVQATGTAVEIRINRYEIYRKLHELKTYLNDGLISQEEYEREAERIRAMMPNAVEDETQELAIRQKEIEEQRYAEETYKAERKRIEELARNGQSLSDKKTLYGFSVNTQILIKSTSEEAIIKAFTTDNRICAIVNGENRVIDFDEVRLL